MNNPKSTSYHHFPERPFEQALVEELRQSAFVQLKTRFAPRDCAQPAIHDGIGLGFPGNEPYNPPWGWCRTESLTPSSPTDCQKGLELCQ